MENKEKDIIDELLNDYGRQKEIHESNFGEIGKEPEPLDKLPQIEKRSEKTAKPEKTKKPVKEKKPKKERVKKERKPINKDKLKKALKKTAIAAAVIIAAAALVFAVIAIVTTAKTAYLKPYKEKYPNINFPAGIEERFCDYYGKNPNTAGYIEIEDIKLKEYILTDNNGKNPVLDKTNSRKGLDFNTVIYLNSADSLEKIYSNKNAYLKGTQKINYSTLFDDYTFNVIGAYYTNKNPQDDSGYVFPYNLTKDLTGKSLDAFTDRLYHRFLYNSDYYLSNGLINKESKLITLCAKTDFMPDFYFVVIGVLDAEKVTAAEDNKNIHYPQIWYDKNNTENSFRFASKWYPEIRINDEETSQQSAEDFTKF